MFTRWTCRVRLWIKNWKKSWFLFPFHTFSQSLSYLLLTFRGPSWFSRLDINLTPSCEDLWKTTARMLILVSLAYPWRVFCFHETCLTFYKCEFFPFLSFFYMYLYVHIVLEIRNPSESRALAHIRLISRQNTLHLKILLQIFGPTCPVCLHVYDCSKEMCRA